jgi:peptidase C25-like protein
MLARLMPCLAVLLLFALPPQAQSQDDPRGRLRPPAPGPTVDYLILTSDELANEFQALAQFKQRHDGFRAEVHTLSEVRAAFPVAVDDVERMRQFLVQYRDQHGTRYVLLGGDVEQVPTRHIHADDGWLQAFGLQPFDAASDLAFVSPEGDWDANHDGQFGTIADAVVLNPTLAVGRAPVRDAGEARRFVDKTLQYERGDARPDSSGGGRHAGRKGAPDVLLLAGDLAFTPTLTSASEAVASTLAALAPLQIERLYDPYAPVPGSLPLTASSLLAALDVGADLVYAFAFGAPDRIEFDAIAASPAPTLDVQQALALRNDKHPFTFLTFAASANDIDTPTSLGEALVRAQHGGAVAVMAPSCIQLLSIQLLLGSEVSRRLYDGSAPALGDALNLALEAAEAAQPGAQQPSLRGRVLLGDPSLRLNSAPAAPLQATIPAVLATPEIGRPLTTAIAGPVAGTALGEPEAGASHDAADLVFAARRPSSKGAALEWSVSVPARLSGQPLELTVFDVTGRCVGGVSGAVARAGANVLRWSPSGRGGAAGPGLYFARLRVAQESCVQRVFLAP